jgi:uncharacterized protein (DUF488 family)
VVVAAQTTLFTIGHGAEGADTFVSRCRPSGLQAIVDIRSLPRSRRHPQYTAEAMANWLPAAAIAYQWDPELGGFRRPLANSINVGLRHPRFRAYADYMASEAFAGALGRVLDAARAVPLAVMCSETLWWRCHRRLVADAAVLLRGTKVLHIDGRGATADHRLTPSATVSDGIVVYR